MASILYSTHRAVIFAIAQLSCLLLLLNRRMIRVAWDRYRRCGGTVQN